MNQCTTERNSWGLWRQCPRKARKGQILCTRCLGNIAKKRFFPWKFNGEMLEIEPNHWMRIPQYHLYLDLNL